MNRTIYTQTRRSIRDNGIRYTCQHAIDVGDTDTLLTCDDIVNTMKETDWLAMRQQWANNSPNMADTIKLTTWIKT